MNRQLLVIYGATLAVAIALGAMLGSIGRGGTGDAASAPTPPPPEQPSPGPAAPTTFVDALAGLPVDELPGHYDAATGRDRDLVARFWSRAEPASFLGRLTSEDPPFFSDPSHALHLFDSWARHDFDAAFEAARALSPFNPHRQHVLHSVVATHMETDPAGAFAALADVWANNGSPNAQVIPFLDAPEESLPHLVKLPRTDVATNAITTALETWAATDPGAALAFATRHRLPAADILTAAQASDPTVADDLLRRLQRPRQRSTAAHNLTLAALRTGDTARAVGLVDHHLDGFYQRNAAGKIATKLAAGDPKAAVSTALTFSAEPARAAALDAALKKFQSGAPQGLALWLGELPPGRDTDRIVDALEKITAAAARRDKKP